MPTFRIETGPSGTPVNQLICPKCGGHWFELLPLGIPGTGSSVCTKCGWAVANWSHEPSKALNTNRAIVDDVFKQKQFECAYKCGAAFPNSAEGWVQLAQHEALHAYEESKTSE